MSTKRKILFAGVALLLLFAGAELISRVVEDLRREPLPPPDATSVLPFQTVPDRTLVPLDGTGKRKWTLRHLDQPAQSIPRDKPAGIARIVLLGGSQAGAMGLSDTASYARRLESLWNQAGGTPRIEVINLAKTGFGAAQIAALAENVLPLLKPDLVLAVFGHNERLDVKAMAATANAPPEALEVSRQLQRHLALARLLRPARNAIEQPGSPLPSWNRDPRWNAFWIARLERSVASLARAAQRVGAAIVFARPPSNLQYVDVREWWWLEAAEGDERLTQARHWLRYGKPERAVELLAAYRTDAPSVAADLAYGLALTEIDSPRASAMLDGVVRRLEGDSQISPERFLTMMTLALVALGQTDRAGELAQGYLATGRGRDAVGGVALLRVGEFETAGRVLRSARDHDEMAIRADAAVAATMNDAAERAGARFVDLDDQYQAGCPGGVCGFDEFIDYCHLSPTGHVRLAGLLLPVVARELGATGIDKEAAQNLEARLRGRLRGREHDFPALGGYLGVGYDLWRISDEKLDDRPTPSGQPTDALGWCFLGDRYFSEGDFARAMEAYRSALELDPKFSAAAANLDLVRRKFGFAE
ncbi:MAG: tetratricopeptide repeat protein [Candidatus Lernaella stagnicola]|nr:tetratricopeptide repeat protein [Candidatus Lernaella stagnicola]